MKMSKIHTQRIRELSLQIQRLEEELSKEKVLALETFRNMSEEDMALCESRYEENGVSVQYFPPSTMKSVDTKKLKEDGLYEKYSKESNKSDYVKVTIKPII